jgi:hypothetical protein
LPRKKHKPKSKKANKSPKNQTNQTLRDPFDSPSSCIEEVQESKGTERESVKREKSTAKGLCDFRSSSMALAHNLQCLMFAVDRR